MALQSPGKIEGTEVLGARLPGWVEMLGSRKLKPVHSQRP